MARTEMGLNLKTSDQCFQILAFYNIIKLIVAHSFFKNPIPSPGGQNWSDSCLSQVQMNETHFWRKKKNKNKMKPHQIAPLICRISCLYNCPFSRNKSNRLKLHIGKHDYITNEGNSTLTVPDIDVRECSGYFSYHGIRWSKNNLVLRDTLV